MSSFSTTWICFNLKTLSPLDSDAQLLLSSFDKQTRGFQSFEQFRQRDDCCSAEAHVETRVPLQSPAICNALFGNNDLLLQMKLLSLHPVMLALHLYHCRQLVADLQLVARSAAAESLQLRQLQLCRFAGAEQLHAHRTQLTCMPLLQRQLA